MLVEEGEEAGRTSTVRAGGGRGVCADRLYPTCAGFPVKSSVTDRVSIYRKDHVVRPTLAWVSEISHSSTIFLFTFRV